MCKRVVAAQFTHLLSHSLAACLLTHPLTITSIHSSSHLLRVFPKGQLRTVLSSSLYGILSRVQHALCADYKTRLMQREEKLSSLVLC